MHSRSLLLLLPLTFFTFSCSTISKKDCTKDMKTLGLSQGRIGSPKKFTDDIRSACMKDHPSIDLEAYEKGFYQGWDEYCLPHRAFEMGKKSDRYFSFCPAEKEAQFRQKYLVGKHHAELKDIEEELADQVESMKSASEKSVADYELYTKMKLELEKVRREIHALEVEGQSSKFKL